MHNSGFDVPPLVGGNYWILLFRNHWRHYRSIDRCCHYGLKGKNMEKVMIKATEVADPLCNGKFFVFKYRIEIEGDRLRGFAHVEGMDYLSAKQEELLDGPEIQAAHGMKFWLNAELENLVREFDENMERLNG